jgi:uncharacterized protein (TIGR02611 family)
MTSPQAPTRRGGGVRERFGAVRGWVRARPGGHLIWRIGVTVTGVLVVVVGIVLLPLPGPGWLIIFAGLGILATEYTWALRLLRLARRLVGDWARWAAGQSLLVRSLLAVSSLIFLIAVLAGCWWLAQQV